LEFLLTSSDKTGCFVIVQHGGKRSLHIVVDQALIDNIKTSKVRMGKVPLTLVGGLKHFLCFPFFPYIGNNHPN
jgi:hypothetical protein